MAVRIADRERAAGSASPPPCRSPKARDVTSRYPRRPAPRELSRNRRRFWGRVTRQTIAALVGILASPEAVVCAATHLGEQQIRVAALIFLADKGVDQPVPLADLVDAVKTRLITCEDARERQLIENRIRVMAYRSETTTGLNDRGQANYDPETNSWSIAKKGAEEVAIWRRMLRAQPDEQARRTFGGLQSTRRTLRRAAKRPPPAETPQAHGAPAP